MNQEQLRNAYLKAPDKIKDFLDSEETVSIINTIGKKYNLRIDQIGRLATIIHAIILGLIKREDFSTETTKQTGLNEDVVNLVVYDLNQQLFSKIRAELEKPEQPTLEAPSPEQVSPEPAPQTPPDQTSKQMFDQKMRGLSGQAKQTVEVEAKTGDNEGAVAPVKARDPYREPI